MDSIRPHSSSHTPIRSTPLSSRKPLSLGNEVPVFPNASSPHSHQRPYRPSSRKRHFTWTRRLLLGGGILGLTGIAAFCFLFFKTIHISHTLSFENTTNPSFFDDLTSVTHALFANPATLKHDENGQIHILLLGRAGEHYPGQNLTDTIMLASINTQTHQVALLSFPRDLYVPIGQSENYTKINAIYQIGLNTQDGVNLLKETIESITHLTIQYSIVVDFDGFEKAIDTIGGISVDVPRDFLDTRYPGKNYSYETFSIDKGWHTLDGATALKYVRERHDDPEGDFGRAKRQQQVMQAVRDKTFSTGTLLNVFTLSRLLDTLGANVKTDITLDELDAFLSLIRTLDTKNITSVVIDAWKPESILRVSHISTPTGNAFILVPRTGNWKEVTDIAQTIFTRDALKQEQARVAHENSTCLIVASPDQTALAEALRHFLTDELGFTSASLRIDPLKNTPEHSTIEDTTGGNKPYSQNALLSRFELESTQNTLSIAHDSSPPADFLLRIGHDLEKSALLGETGTAPEDINTDILPPTKPSKKSEL